MWAEHGSPAPAQQVLTMLLFYPGRQLGMGGAGLSWGEAVGSLSTELVPGAPSAPDTNC